MTFQPHISIVFRDELLLVLDKPSGLAVHRGWARDREVLVDLARELAEADQIFPLHRLDRGTSGVIVFALHAAGAAELAAAFESRQVHKRYLALVRGVPPESGVVDHAIPRRPGGPRVPAVTEYRRLATVAIEPRTLSLVEARPQTGRLHQVRRHLKHLSHPVMGDANYGHGPLNREVRARYGLSRLALHAAEISLFHPGLGREMTFAAPLPEDLRLPLACMGFPSHEW